MKSKYIVFDNAYSFLIFPETMGHDIVADRLGLKREQIQGAGFVNLLDDKYFCYGESVSLNICSRRKEDSDLLNMFNGSF
jgi:hypothetical protein